MSRTTRIALRALVAIPLYLLGLAMALVLLSLRDMDFPFYVRLLAVGGPLAAAHLTWHLTRRRPA